MNPAIKKLDPRLKAIVDVITQKPKPGDCFGTVVERVWKVQDAHAGCSLYEVARMNQMIDIIRTLAK